MSDGGMGQVAMSELVEEALNNDPEKLGGVLPKQFMPEQKNYAADEETKAYVSQEIVPLLQWNRDKRASLEEEWRSIDKMEMLEHDNGQRYLGKSRAYLPVFNKNASTMVASLSRGLFPSDEYMDVTDRDAGDPEKARAVKTYMQWEFDVVAGVRSRLKPFLRPYVKYGNSVLKFWYEKCRAYEGRLDNQGVSSFQPVSRYEGLCVSARNIFNWYIYPWTAAGIHEATLIFEDIDVPRTYFEQMKQQKEWENVDEAYGAAINPTHSSNRSEQLMSGAKIYSDPAEMGQRKHGGQLTVTEVHVMMPLPNGAYFGDELHGTPLPTKIVFAGSVPLSIRRNTAWHQRPPYLLARQNVQPGNVYGYGMGRTSRHLQYLANDFMNQTNDCGQFGLNPIVKAIPGKLAGPLKPMAPGVVWNVSEQDAISFDRPPIEQVQYGLQLVSTLISMAQDFNGTPPILQGTNTGKGAKTATSSQILQFNSRQPIQDVVEEIELDVMIPLLRGAWVNAQQYRDEAVMTYVAGRELKVSPSDLAIDAEFRWLASSQAANQQQRAQQAMQLMQTVMPLLPIITQSGYVVDFVPLIRRVYADGFGFRGFEDFIKKAQGMGALMPGQAAAGGMTPGAVPGVQAEQGDRIRSALEQAGGEVGGDIAPGEGSDFMQVRDNADDIAGSYGGLA